MLRTQQHIALKLSDFTILLIVGCADSARENIVDLEKGSEFSVFGCLPPPRGLKRGSGKSTRIHESRVR